MGPYDLLEEDESELSPYAAITDRQPLEPVSVMDQQAPMDSNPVRDMIASRMGGIGRIPSSGGAELAVNMGQAFSNLARGGSAPVDQSSFYANLNKQNENAQDTMAKDQMARQQAVANAIKMKQAESLVGKRMDWDKEKLKSQQDLQRELSNNQINAANQRNSASLSAQKDKIQGENAVLKPTQYQAAVFAKRLSDAESVFGDLKGNKKFDPTSMSAAAERSSFYPEMFKSEGSKLQDQAERNFINAVLRKESGSAISDAEFASAEKQYFPRQNDPQSVLANKEQNRRAALAGLQAEAGPAASQVDSRLASIPININQKGGGSSGLMNEAIAGDDQPKKQYSASRNQTRFVYPDGRVEVKNGRF